MLTTLLARMQACTRAHRRPIRVPSRENIAGTTLIDPSTLRSRAGSKALSWPRAGRRQHLLQRTRESDSTLLLDSAGSRCRYASAKHQIQPNIWQKPRLTPWKPAHLHAPRRGSLKGPQTRCGDSGLNGKGRSSAGARLPPNELMLLPRSHVKVKGRSKQSNREGRFILYLIHRRLHLLHLGADSEHPARSSRDGQTG